MALPSLTCADERYDVVLINPPFGDASLPSKQYIDDHYGDIEGGCLQSIKLKPFRSGCIPMG